METSSALEGASPDVRPVICESLQVLTDWGNLLGIVTRVISPFSRGLHFRRVRRISYIMDGFCLFYLLLILLMRSGDVETNPGPNTAESTLRDTEFLKLAQDIHPSHYNNVGISLGFNYAQIDNILRQKSNNYADAFFDLFMKWNVKQQPPHSIKWQLLADKFEKINLDISSATSLHEPLTRNSTGGPSRLLESQTEPLSPGLVAQCANEFKFKYRSTLCKIRVDPLNPASTVQFEDMHTNLVLQEEHGTEKRMLDYNGILDLKVNGEFPKRIMVQGEAGAGKTTYCAKIAWDWIEGRYFSHFVWVLIVPLREFKLHMIGEIAKSYLAKNNPASASQITEYIRSNPDKVFIAFDGLDEVSGKITKSKSCESQQSVTSSETRQSSSETGDIELVDILCSDQLASCPVLVTTRPWRAVEIRSDGDLMKLYTFIHVEGFSRENLSVYIHKYFPENEDKANQLIQLTNDNDVISENMAQSPLFVAMLCLMWNRLDERKLKEMKSLKTFSQVFRVMIAFLKEHYAQKEVKKVGVPLLHAFLKEIDELLRPIAKQALNGLLENTLVFDEEDFEICPKSKDTACRVGILSQEDRISISMDRHQINSHVQLPVFFPHKLFQEYMAGVHLAFLYQSDRKEFDRLLEQNVLPRKEEYRYLLYFTVSQNRSIATHIIESLHDRVDRNSSAIDEELSFIVDVAFESHDLEIAALVKNKFSSELNALEISWGMGAHTVAGYVFIRPCVVELGITRDCGPTMSLDVAEIMCSMPSLRKLFLRGEYHHCLFATLARKGYQLKVKTLKLNDVQCRTPASFHHLAEALCSMPNLTDLILGSNLNDEFYSRLKAMASSVQVKTLKLHHVECCTPASSHHLAEALCSMPNLTYVTFGKDFNEEFYSTLKAKASSLQIKTLKLHAIKCCTPASSHHLAEALCSMPNLTDVTFGRNHVNEEFFSTLKAKASSIQVKTLKLHDVKCHTPTSSHHLVEAFCSMPNLTDLTLGWNLNEEFYSTLKAKASSIQVQTFRLHVTQCPTPASSHHLVEALCSMPNLTDLTLGLSIDDASDSSTSVLRKRSYADLAEDIFSMPNRSDVTRQSNSYEEFFSTFKSKASSIQVQTLKLRYIVGDEVVLHHLAEALCSMPNLTDLITGDIYENSSPNWIRPDHFGRFYRTLKAKASSTQGCFPQIRKGNFRFNGVAQNDLKSLLHALTCSDRQITDKFWRYISKV